MEIWREVDFANPKYEVSNLGNVRKTRGICRELSQYTDKNGIKYVKLIHKGVRKNAIVHRLVMDSFGLTPYSEDKIYHRDGDKSNNNITNLYYKRK